MTHLDHLLSYGEVRIHEYCGSNGEDETALTVILRSGNTVTLKTGKGLPGTSPTVTLINAMLSKLETLEEQAKS